MSFRFSVIWVQGVCPHRAALARRSKPAKIVQNIHVKIQIVTFVCICVQ